MYLDFQVKRFANNFKHFFFTAVTEIFLAYIVSGIH